LLVAVNLNAGAGNKMELTIDCQTIEKYIRENHPHMKTALVEIEDIEFEQRLEILCFYCARYNAKWTCPPRIPKVDYKKAFSEYDKAMFIYHLLPIEDDYGKIRTDSSLILHRTILDAENFLLRSGNAMRISFIGGCCKLCKNDCAPDKCRNPYQARIPLEATGVNVIKTAKKCGINISFPVTEMICRIGLILW
jgi:predicted metal-binding protein